MPPLRLDLSGEADITCVEKTSCPLSWETSNQPLRCFIECVLQILIARGMPTWYVGVSGVSVTEIVGECIDFPVNHFFSEEPYGTLHDKGMRNWSLPIFNIDIEDWLTCLIPQF